MTEVHSCVQKRRGFSLEPDELYRDPSRTVVCNNKGDEDNLIYGDLCLDDRDALDGFGVSAAWEDEMTDTGDWSVFVNDFDSFSYLREQEERISRAEEGIARCRKRIQIIEEELDGLRSQARDDLKRFGSIEPSVYRRGMYLSGLIVKVQEEEAALQQQLANADDTVQRIESKDNRDADQVSADWGSYNLIHWNAVYRQGEALVEMLAWKMEKLESPELSKLITDISTKRKRRELTFEHFVHLTGTLNAEMYRRTGVSRFYTERNRMVDLWKRYHLGDRKNVAPYFSNQEVLFDPSERQFGETRLTESELVDAIDIRANASQMSKRHNVSFDEAITMLTGEWE